MSEKAIINYCWNDFVNNESRNGYYSVYQHYYAYLLYVGIKKGFDAETVKDTVNDIFLYFWEKRFQLKHIQNHHNYILTYFIRSLCKNNKDKTVLPVEMDDSDWFSAPPCDEQLLHDEHDKVLYDLISKQIKQLTPKQRLLIYQKFYLGFSYDEISRFNHISISTVYNTVYAAMDKLRRLLPRDTVITLISVMVIAFAIFFAIR